MFGLIHRTYLNLCYTKWRNFMSKWRKYAPPDRHLQAWRILGCDAALLGKWVLMFQRSNFPHLHGFMVILHKPWILDKKVTHSSEQSATPCPATQWHIQVDKILIILLWNLTTHAYRFHVLVLNYCISANGDPNPWHHRVTKPYGIKKCDYQN
jgi:hypothetical protein